MSTIDLNTVPVEHFVDIYNPDGSLLIRTNDILTFDYIRVQIKRAHAEGFKMKTDDGYFHEILPNGSIRYSHNSPLPGDTWEEIIDELL